MNTVAKPKKCRVCKSEFVPFNSLDAWCSPKCKIKGQHKKQMEKENKLPKLVMGSEIIKPKEKQQVLQYTQDVVNAYILVRDKYEGCITCGAYGDDVVFHAGHFRSVGAAAHLRFNFNNIHKQCKECNIELSSNRVCYEENLPLKIGHEKTQWLINNNRYRKYSEDYCKRIRKIAALKKRKLERARK